MTFQTQEDFDRELLKSGNDKKIILKQILEGYASLLNKADDKNIAHSMIITLRNFVDHEEITLNEANFSKSQGSHAINILKSL